MVRAKFKLERYETSMQTIWKDGQPTGQEEMRTLHFSVVHATGDPNHENSKFWKFTPAGTLMLGTVNKAAWEQFDLGGEYYLDLSLASPPPVVKPAD
jgi:hypothetical protein